MAEFEDKLNALLSSPESMQQVAQLAQMLSAQHDGDAAAPPFHAENSAAASHAVCKEDDSISPEQVQAAVDGLDLSALMGGIDMKTISRFLPLLQELNGGGNDERAQLLYALKPFLKPERQEKIDTALRLARLFHVGKTFFKGIGHV